MASSKFHVPVGALSLDQKQAEGADAFGHEPFALGNIASQLGNIHRLAGGKILELTYIVNREQEQQAQQSPREFDVPPSFAHFQGVNPILDNHHRKRGIRGSPSEVPQPVSVQFPV